MGGQRSIAMVLPGPFPTRQGTQVLVTHLARSLCEAGHEVHLITYGYGEYEETFPFMVHRAQRVDVGFRSGPSFLKPAADAALLLEASRVIKAHRCDLIHVHNVEGIGVGALLKLHHRIPVVYHSHNSMGLELPTYYKRGAVRAFAGLLGEVVDRTLPRVADAVVAFDAEHARLHAQHGVAPERITVIPPGLSGNDLTRPSRDAIEKAQEGLPAGRRLLYAGNPDGYQNLCLLYEALKQLRETRPEVRLLIASHHPLEAFMPELEACGLRDGVDYLNCCELESIAAAHAISQIGVCPRAIWTGFPIKVLNYLATGLPVVGCRGAVASAVGSDTGVLSEADPTSFANAIAQALDKEGGWDGISIGSSWKICSHIERYERMYSEVLAAWDTHGRSEPLTELL